MNFLVIGSSEMGESIISQLKKHGHHAFLFPNYDKCLLGEVGAQSKKLSDVVLSDSEFLLYTQMQARRGRFYNYHPDLRDEVSLSITTISIFFQKSLPDIVVFQNIPHEGFDYLIYNFCQKKNIKTVLLYQSIFKNRFFISSNFEDLWQNKLKLAPELRVADVSGAKLPYMKYVDSPFASVIKLYKAIVRIFQFKWLENFRSRAFHRLARVAEVPLKMNYHRNHKKYFNCEFSSFDYKETPYIYFPLHLQPELTTAAIGGKYDDQLLALERLVRMIPKEFKILVKENPKQSSRYRSNLFYKRLLSIPNVCLVKRGTSSSQLIKYAYCVCTVTGTAGWEALLAGKQVVYFGRPWYCGFTGAYGIEEISESFFEKSFDVCYEKLDYEFKEFSRTMAIGVVDPYYKFTLEKFEHDKNAFNVVSAIIKYLA